MGFSDPKKNIAQLSVEDGMRVADFGSGSGHYTVAAADAVGDTGRVYAIDIQQALLKKVKNLSTNEHKKNIEVIWGDLERVGGSKLREESMDVVLIANTLFQVENKDAVIKEAYRVLKQKGRLLVIDWTDSFGGLGPQPAYVIHESDARLRIEKGGFVHDRSIDAGAHHYGLIFRKSSG